MMKKNEKKNANEIAAKYFSLVHYLQEYFKYFWKVVHYNEENIV